MFKSPPIRISPLIPCRYRRWVPCTLSRPAPSDFRHNAFWRHSWEYTFLWHVWWHFQWRIQSWSKWGFQKLYNIILIYYNLTSHCEQCDIFRQSYFQVSCRFRMPATLIWPQQNVGISCQNGNMAALLNSLFSGLKFRFCLSIVSYTYYDYIVCKVVQLNIPCNVIGVYRWIFHKR